MIKVNKNLALFSGLFLVIASVFFFLFQKLSPLIGNITYYCQSFINTHVIPIPYYLSFILFGLLFLVLIFTFIRLLLLSIKVQRLKHTLKDKKIIQNKVDKLLKNLGLYEVTVVVQSRKRFAFCLGVRKPKIYISTGLISQLNNKEIETVLRHEQYHLENHDTFIMIIASVAKSIFPIFPLIGDLIKKYKIEREIRADKFAVEHVGDAKYLIEVLRKLLLFPALETTALAAIADQDTLEPRIHALFNKKHKYRKYKIKHLLVTSVSIFAIGAITMVPVHATEINYQENHIMMLCTDSGKCMNSCMNKESVSKLYSETPDIRNMSKPTSSYSYSSNR